MDALSAGGSASITVQAHSDVETSDSFFILATAPGDIDDSNDREILAIPSAARTASAASATRPGRLEQR